MVLGREWGRISSSFLGDFLGILVRRRVEGGRGEDKLKSAMRIKSFCHDIVYFEKPVFGR